jgi:hypothetical protein
MGHALIENRSGLIVAATLTKATATAEREAAEETIVRHSPGARRLTLGADKGYDAAAFVTDMRALSVTPHIAQSISGRRSAIDARTTRHPGYAVSQEKSGEPGEEKAHRGAVRLGQDDWRARTANATVCQKARLQVHPHNSKLQSDASAKAHRGYGMSAIGHLPRTSPNDSTRLIQKPSPKCEFQQPARRIVSAIKVAAGQYPSGTNKMMWRRASSGSNGASSPAASAYTSSGKSEVSSLNSLSYSGLAKWRAYRRPLLRT